MRENFINHQQESGLCEAQKSKRQNVLNRILLALLAILFLPIGAWADFGINTNSGSHWVTGENNDVLEDGNHKITYDATNNVLTLNGIDLSFTSDVSYTAFIAMVDTDQPNITVRLVGNNTLTLGDKACFFNGWGITFTTDASEPGTLTINPGDNWGGALFIYNPTSQSMNATYNNGLELIQNGNTYTIQAPVTSYNITVAGTAVTSANASNVLGDNETPTVIFTPANNTVSPATPATLTLNGATLNGSIVLQSGLDDLTIHLLGDNKIQGADYQNPLANGIKRENGATTGTLTFTTASGASGTLFFPYVTTPIEGFENIVYNNGLEWGCDSYIEDNKVCTNFYEGVGTNVVLASASWQDCITKSQPTLTLTSGATITFREDNSLGRVLTLSGFTDCNTSLWWYSHSDVKFEISGTNSFTFSQGNPMLVGNDQSNVSFIATGTSAATLRFWHKGTGANRLYLTEPFISGFKNSANPGLGEGLYNVDVVDTRRDPDINDNTDYTEHYITTEAYDLKVSAVRVHNLNGVFKGHKDHILGEISDGVFNTSVTFAPASTTLTLNGASITHTEDENAIISSLSTPLYVHLLGENTINSLSYLPFEGATGDDTNLVFTTTTDANPGSLTLISTHAGFGKTTFYTGFNEVQYPEDSGFLYAKEESGNVIISQNQSYDLTIAGVNLTKDNVSADGTVTGIAGITSGTVKFTPANTTVSPATPATLTLTNATIIPTTENAGIVYEGEADLTISLIGTSMVKGIGGCPAITRYNDGSVPSLAFTKGDTQACSVQLVAQGETVIDCFTNISYDGLYRLNNSSGEGATLINTTTFTSVLPYDLWIGDTQVTSANAANVLDNGKVSFTAADPQQANSVNTLTLNGATLTVPVKVGLANLTIDIQGANTITTDGTCIQNVATTGTPSLTFTSSSETGSLILTKGGDSFITNIGQNNISVSKKLAVLMTVYGTEDYTSNLNYITDGSTTVAKFVPSYGVQVNDMQVYAGNYTDVLKNGKVSFDKSTHTLTLNNVSGIEAISTTLSTLDIDLVGSNSLYRESNGSIFESASGEAMTINLKSTGATKGSLTVETPANYGATLKGDNVTLTPVDPIVLLSSNVENNKGTLVYGVSYGLTVAGVTVSNANASNVLGGATATVVFTPANNTASPATPATLTLNGADNLGTILSGLENLKVVINGDNAAVQVKANSAVSGNKNITFEGGTNGGTLAISAGDGGSVVSGFASVSYDGAYAAANVPFGYDKTASQQGYRKSHMMDDNSYLETLTITTVPHYPIWLYTNVTTSTQINNTNKNTLLGASGNVSFDGSNTLSLKNSVNCTARIVSGLSDLKISIDGDCIIESPDSGSVVRSINSSAPLTIEKASGASSASLKLAAVSFTAIKAFASLDYTGLILLSEGATYSSGALKGSKGEPLNEAIFTSSLKKPTIQMNYDDDTYSFQNPNGGGTLKYKRTYIDGTETVNDEGEMSNTTFNIDGRPDYFEVWVEANGNSSEKLYACRLDVKDMTATYGGTVPNPVFLPKSVEGVTVSGYSLGGRTAVAATVTEGNITLTGAGRQELDAIFSIPDGVEYIKTSITETPQASFFLDVKPAKPTLSKTAGTYTGTQNVTVTNLTPNATPMYYTYEGEEPANPVGTEFTVDGGVNIESSKTLVVYYRASYETETSMEYLYGETTKADYTILTDPELTYKQGETSVTTATWTIGKDNNTALPVLQNTHNVVVTYESDNTAVATVATDGTVTVVGTGTATITATAAATAVSAADEAYYTLTVNRQMNVSFDATNEWATYYGTENLATPAGLKAYQVTAVNGSTVTTAEIGYIPANTAVLLQNVEGKTAAANTIASAYTGATSTFPNNLLIGSTEAVGVSSINGGTVYVLYNDMFKRATSGMIPANRAYLVVSGAAPARLNIVHGGDDTGIDNIRMDETNDSWYTIDGRKLSGQPQRAGFYIRNGKKVYKR